MKTMTAKYSGTCKECGGRISVGETILWARKQGARHLSCGSDAAEAQTARRASSRMDSEYAAGVADAQRYLDEKSIYGEALAEQFAMMDEHNRYWKHGEDY